MFPCLLAVLLLLHPKSGHPCFHVCWGVQIPCAGAGARAGCWLYASEGASVSLRLLPQPGAVKGICFLQVITVLWQQAADGQNRCGRCVGSAITVTGILHRREVGWLRFVKKMNGKCEVMRMLQRTARKRNTYVLWLAI